MNFERHQVSLVFDKLYREIKGDISNIFDNNGDPKYIVDISDNDGKLKRLKFGNKEGTFAVHVEKESGGFKIQMRTRGSMQMDGKYEYVFVCPFLWSKVWWKWRRLSKMIMRNLSRLRSIEAEMKRRQNDENFNMIYVEMFPDEVNRILLGGKMINSLLRWLFPQHRTDLQVVLDKIASQKEVRSARIAMSMDGRTKPLDIENDLNFMVGKPSFSTGYTFKYFLVQFNTGDTGCIVKLKGDDVPLFTFDDSEEVKEIRKAIIRKYHEMVERENKLRESNFLNM